MFTYDIATNLGQIRLLIPDRKHDRHFFEDEELNALRAMQPGLTDTEKNLQAAASALEVIASDEAYVLKVVKLLDLTTNGPATAAELRARAQALWAQAAAVAAATTTVAEFDIAEWVVNDFSGRERLDAEALRNG